MDIDNFADLLAQATGRERVELSGTERLDSDLGLTSFDLMVLASLAQARTGLSVDFGALSTDLTVRGFLNALQANREG